MGKMFDSCENDVMVLLRGNDLRDLLLYLESYFLEYRDTLGLPDNVTFGLELEYEKLRQKLTDEFIEKSFPDWESVYDGTVSSGGEVRSPILHDTKEAWDNLKSICTFLRENGATTMENAGGHIHVGAHILGNDRKAALDFLKLYTAYEHVLLRFFYGDKINARKSLFEYAIPVSSVILYRLNYYKEHRNLSLEQIIGGEISGKYRALNFGNIVYSKMDKEGKKNTIEFRGPNATIYEVVEQNNVNVCTKMLLASKRRVMDTEFLDYKIEHEFFPYKGNEYRYREVCLKDALEFVDLVFDSNIDKLYFLRQYLKDFSSNYKLDSITEAKKFFKV